MRAERRRFLSMGGACALLATLPLSTYAAPGINTKQATLLAAWQLASGQFQVGVLQFNPTEKMPFDIQLAVDLPTRPHGLMHLAGDEYWVLARRPGDWMMRLNVRTGDVARIWQDAGRHLNGHSVVLGNRIYTTETDLENGDGAVGVRDRVTFELLDVWPSGGHDPHEMLALPQGFAGIHEPVVLVANGGIQTHADMGRARVRLDDMDSSLVALHADTGQVLGQWTLRDPLLSLRHLALHSSGVVGVAMQAQHDSDALQDASPVLALLDSSGLQAVADSAGVKGYAGDIVATPHGFAVSCTRHHALMCVDLQGKRMSMKAARSACALAARDERVWLGHQADAMSGAIELDNHWLILA